MPQYRNVYGALAGADALTKILTQRKQEELAAIEDERKQQQLALENQIKEQDLKLRGRTVSVAENRLLLDALTPKGGQQEMFEDYLDLVAKGEKGPKATRYDLPPARWTQERNKMYPMSPFVDVTGGNIITRTPEGGVAKPITTEPPAGSPPGTPGEPVGRRLSAEQNLKLAQLDAGSDILNYIQKLYKPDYVGPGAGRAYAVREQLPENLKPIEDLAESMGMGWLVPRMEGQRSEFMEAVDWLHVQTLNEISGAAVNEHEAFRIQKAIPDYSKNQTKFESNMRGFGRVRSFLRARIQALKQSGFQWDEAGKRWMLAGTPVSQTQIASTPGLPQATDYGIDFSRPDLGLGLDTSEEGSSGAGGAAQSTPGGATGGATRVYNPQTSQVESAGTAGGGQAAPSGATRRYNPQTKQIESVGTGTVTAPTGGGGVMPGAVVTPDGRLFIHGVEVR
jgi:hypothetical protein